MDSVLEEAFALVREGSRRVLGLRPFDVQLMGGMILNEGEIAEMRTGEGKTLVAVLPAFLNALAGKGVHVVTVNDYLAKRDSEWVGQVHKFLGLEVGLIQAGMEEADRQKAYACDVTYVTNSELGFDYLRDNLAQRREELVQRDPFFCVIDEVDSILIDEARTPLIISGTADKPSEKYEKAAKVAGALAKDVHYTVDEKQRNVLITEEGYEAAEEVLGVADLYDPKTQWATFLLNAIKAKELFKKDVAYITKNKEVVIVDEFTGRTMPGRRWGDGLHQAIEAKEGIKIQEETITIASITYQALFRMYPRLGGMTGTALTEKKEFSDIYGLETTVVPPNRKVAREDFDDVVFARESGKWSAVVTEVRRMNRKGRPVLVGTTSVESSEQLAAMLEGEDIACQVLNAKPENVERESEIVAQAGRKGVVTIATNMAGRGTDILLGGNAEFMARLRLREAVMPRIVSIVDGEGGKLAPKSWKVAPGLYPAELGAETSALVQKAVNTAVSTWGERRLEALEAEDRLAYACEKGPTDDPTLLALRAAFVAIEADFDAVVQADRDEVKSLGGLHVIGTERHESRRIDNQLRGRGGRQGDPGSTRFFLSLEDNLFRVFGGDRIQGMMSMFQVDDLPIESGMLTKSLDEAQRKVEAYFFDIRKNLFEYDQVVNTQRSKVYAERRLALLAPSLEQKVLEYSEKTVDDILEANVNPQEPVSTWNLGGLRDKMVQYCPIMAGDGTEEGGLSVRDLTTAAGGGGKEGFASLRAYMRKAGAQAYQMKRDFVEEVDAGLMTEAERFFVLRNVDQLWKEHLQAIKFIQQAVGLRGYAQRDPLTEFKLESYNLYMDMMAQVRRNVIYNVYVFEPAKARRAADGKAEVPQKVEA